MTSGSPFFAFLEIQAIFEVVAPSDVEDPRSRPCGPGALCGWDEIHGETLWLVDALEYDFLYICQKIHFIYGICFLSSQVTNSVIFQRGTVTDRILEMKKGSRAAGIGKGSGPKPRQKISDITDFQKNEFWK